MAAPLPSLRGPLAQPTSGGNGGALLVATAEEGSMMSCSM